MQCFISPYINRFLQPDTIIPNPANPQSGNRFSYTLNRPVNWNDPSGHISEWCETDPNSAQCKGYVQDQKTLGKNLGKKIRARDKDQDGLPETPDPSFPEVSI